MTRAKAPPPHPSWTLQETWVWQECRAGNVADLGKRPGSKVWDDLDPARGEGWPADRTVTERFLRKVLCEANYRIHIHPAGLRIKGARFEGALDLEDVRLPGALALVSCCFEGYTSLRGASSTQSVSLAGSCFYSALVLRDASIGGNLFLGGVQADVIDLRGLRMGGRLDIEGADCDGPIALDSGAVGMGVDARGAMMENLYVRSTRIGGSLALDGATITGGLHVEASSIGGSVLAWELDLGEDAGVELVRTSVGGDILLSEDAARTLVLMNCSVGGDLMLGIEKEEEEENTQGEVEKPGPPRKGKGQGRPLISVMPGAEQSRWREPGDGILDELARGGYHGWDESMLYAGFEGGRGPLVGTAAAVGALVAGAAGTLARRGYRWPFTLLWALIVLGTGALVAKYAAPWAESPLRMSLDVLNPFVRLGPEHIQASLPLWAETYFALERLTGFGLGAGLLVGVGRIALPRIFTPGVRRVMLGVISGVLGRGAGWVWRVALRAALGSISARLAGILTRVHRRGTSKTPKTPGATQEKRTPRPHVRRAQRQVTLPAHSRTGRPREPRTYEPRVRP